MIEVVQILDPAELTVLEVQELAAAAGVAVVERGGKTAFCNASRIPDGWHRTAIHAKESSNG